MNELMEYRYRLFNNRKLNNLVKEYISYITGEEYEYDHIKDNNGIYSEIIYSSKETLILSRYYNEKYGSFNVDLDEYLSAFLSNEVLYFYVEKLVNHLITYREDNNLISMNDKDYLEYFKLLCSDGTLDKVKFCVESTQQIR